MNLKIGFIFILGIFLLGIISAESCSLGVNLLNQDPYPASPGDYVKVVFQVSGTQNPNCEGAVFEIAPSYPFSIDGNDSIKKLDGSTWVSDYKTEWMIPYKIKVDKDAIDGNATLKIRYGQNEAFVEKYFDIAIEDPRTYFDAVIQEISNGDVSIAIANTGIYTANSVVVRIPEQENFITTGTDGQMVGNLDSGDYTIVSFSLKSVVQRDMQPYGTNISRGKIQNLKFDIYYTDSIGERRIVNMELPLQMNSNMTQGTGAFVPNMRTKKSSGINWTAWIIFVVIVAILGTVYKKYPKQLNE